MYFQTIGLGGTHRCRHATSAVCVEPVAARANGLPHGAELVEALTIDVAGLVVADVQVERVSVVGDLHCSVTASHRAQEVRLRGTHCMRDTGCRKRRPDAGT